MAVAAASYEFVTDYPGFETLDMYARQEAWGMVEISRHAAKESSQGPLVVDALSTADKVLLNEGFLPALAQDCQRIIAEWRHKNRHGYFRPLTHKYDSLTEDYYADGISMLGVTEGGLKPLSRPEETERSVNDRIQLKRRIAIQKMGGLAARQVVRTRQIMECPDWTIERYEEGNRDGFYGYVPAIKKWMALDTEIDVENGVATIEQVALPGNLAGHEGIIEFLVSRGLNAKHLSKTELQGALLLVEDELLDFVADFDQYLSNKLDATVFAGELVDADHPLDYQAIKDEALLHEQQLEGHTNMLVDFVLELARARTDRRQAPEIVEDFVKKMMLAVAGDDYQLALDMFDQPTARGLQEVAIFRANNYEIAANLRFIEVEAQAPGGGYCGAGECGLEWVTDNNTDASKLKELGFNAKDSLRDTERKCKCGEKTVVYELKKAMKGCTSCGATTKY